MTFAAARQCRVPRQELHQSQAVELPEKKILLAFGQHPLCRRLIIFDPDWLLEKHREDDFALGLGGWSVQQYLKSVLAISAASAGIVLTIDAPALRWFPPEACPAKSFRWQGIRSAASARSGRRVWNFPCWPRGSLKLRCACRRDPKDANLPGRPLVQPGRPRGVAFCSARTAAQCAGASTTFLFKTRHLGRTGNPLDQETAKFRISATHGMNSARLSDTQRNQLPHLQSAAAEADPYAFSSNPWSFFRRIADEHSAAGELLRMVEVRISELTADQSITISPC